MQWGTGWGLFMALAGLTTFHLFLQTYIHLWPPNIAPSEALHLNNPWVRFMKYICSHGTPRTHNPHAHSVRFFGKIRFQRVAVNCHGPSLRNKLQDLGKHWITGSPPYQHALSWCLWVLGGVQYPWNWCDLWGMQER